MSELFSIEVIEAGPELKLRVTTLHPDAGRPPEAKSFVVNVLVDLWKNHQTGDTSSVWQRLTELSFGKEVPITPEQYEAMRTNRDARVIDGAPVGMFSNTHATVEYPQELLAAEAEKLVTSVVHENAEHAATYDAWAEGNDVADDALPQVTIRATFADPSVIVWARPGTTFGTAQYW